jgi:type II secretory pathway component GspD/PulD (secretin)
MTNYGRQINIVWKDIGIELKVTPLIGAPSKPETRDGKITRDGLIQLDIKQTVDNVVGRTNIETIGLMPIIGSRRAESTVQVVDGEVIALAGLQEAKPENSMRSTPVLSKLPLLKKLFTKRTLKSTKRDLVFFIRPTIIHENDRVILEEEVQKLEVSDDLKKIIETRDLISDDEKRKFRENSIKENRRLGNGPDQPSDLPSSN